MQMAETRDNAALVAVSTKNGTGQTQELVKSKNRSKTQTPLEDGGAQYAKQMVLLAAMINSTLRVWYVSVCAYAKQFVYM